MKAITLGASGEKVSALCLGTMELGTKVGQQDSMRLLDRYCEAGGRFIDTANNYGNWSAGAGWESETVVGRWMRERKNRDDLFLVTKVGANPPAVGWGLSRKVIMQEIDESLRRLGTDRVDLYYAHIDSRADDLEETLAAFDQLHRQGKIRNLGCSNYRAWRIEEARALSRSHGWIGYCCAQLRHTYLRPVHGTSFHPQVFVDDEIMDYGRAHAADFLVLGYSTTLGGFYAGRGDRPLMRQYRGQDSDARMLALAAVARETGATPVQVVLAWMLQSSPVVLPLVSASTLEQLDEDLGALQVTLDDAQLKRLSDAGADNLTQ
jgi:aryl-alcohol dehydrogenase-like predicted oxidoreductase